jgi:adenylate cyclase
MTNAGPQRRLAAIVCIDVAGYSRLMGADEEGTLAAFKRHERELVVPAVGAHRGRIIKTTGDGFLLEFGSAVEAVRCALAIQAGMLSRNSGVGSDRRIEFRTGINLGDVIVDGDDVYGDGVNIAARLEQIAEPNSIVVSEDIYRQVSGKVAAEFGNLGPKKLKNIDQPVRAYVIGAAGTPAAPHLALPDMPSVAVLPFDNLTGEPAQEYLVDGMVEEITAALSRIKPLFVIARNSAFTYKGRPVRIDQVGRELGVRYVVEGSVRKAGPRLRVTAQLIEAESDHHVWADRFDGAVEDVFDLYDQITERLVGAMHPSIQLAEIERARRKRPESLDAYDYVMQAMPHVWALQRADNAKAMMLLEAAIERDPNYPMALALMAWCHAQQVTYIWTTDFQASIETALRLARQAADISADDPLVLTVLSITQTFAHRYDIATSLIERALALDPNLPLAWNRSGWVHAYQGRSDIAISHFGKAMRLSPHDPMNFNCHFGIGVAHFAAERYADAVASIERGLAERPSALWVYRTYSAALAHSGRLEEAREAVATLRREYPGITLATVRASSPTTRTMLERIVDGLRKAGFPE